MFSISWCVVYPDPIYSVALQGCGPGPRSFQTIVYIRANVGRVPGLPGRIRYTTGVLCYKYCMDDRPGFIEVDSGR